MHRRSFLRKTTPRYAQDINSKQVAADWIGAAPLPDLDLEESGASKEEEQQ